MQAPAATITAGIAADNLVVALFFITLFALANNTPCDKVCVSVCVCVFV